ncbi:MAG: J domain-containing protein [Bdellovibrionota bacterium]
MKNYYKILGLNFNATQKEISKAYKTLARKYHPDINNEPDASEKFKEISESYETLKNLTLKQEYDEKIKKIIISAYTKSASLYNSQNNSQKNNQKDNNQKNIKTTKKSRLKTLLKKYLNRIKNTPSLFRFSKKDKKEICIKDDKLFDFLEIYLTPKEAIMGTKKTILVDKEKLTLKLQGKIFKEKILKIKHKGNPIFIILKIKK